MYELLYDGEKPPELPNLPKRKSAGEIAWGTSGRDARMLMKLRQLLGKTSKDNQQLLLSVALKMARRKAG
jgi:hypothetical protein